MKPKLSKTEIAEAKFWKLSPAQKRVAIAKDVILQIKAEYYTAIRGTYINAELPWNTSRTEMAPAREAFAEADNCTVCAVGSTIVSGARLGNRVSLFDLGVNANGFGGDEARDKFFPRSMNRLMEEAFEVDYDPKRQYHKASLASERKPNTRTMQYRAEYFGEGFKTSDARLIAIMRNVIRNKGAFIPPMVKGH